MFTFEVLSILVNKSFGLLSSLCIRSSLLFLQQVPKFFCKGRVGLLIVETCAVFEVVLLIVCTEGVVLQQGKTSSFHTNRSL